MTELPLGSGSGGGRFPGFSVLSQVGHWDAATSSIVMRRVGTPLPVRFFTEAQAACANALFDQLLDQRAEPRVPVTSMVDSRLAEQEFDGWHYAGMPLDDEAWRRTLDHLDEDARDRHDVAFSELSWDAQHAQLEAIHRLGSEPWHGLPAARVWSLWTRYACAAFYSHPWAWEEIGFPGPAYPRGYKNLGVDRREPFEVADTHVEEDPVLKDPS